MTIVEVVGNFIKGIRSLNVPRIEDLPYWTSPPVIYTFQSTAPLVLGTYTWNDLPSVLVPPRPVLTSTVYFIRQISLAADIEELDFTSAIVATPQFSMYKVGDANALLFREPIQMVKFFDKYEYRLAFSTVQEGDQLLAGFRGQLTQTAGLIGKASITLKAVVTVQEISDNTFVKLFKKPFPAPAEI